MRTEHSVEWHKIYVIFNSLKIINACKQRKKKWRVQANDFDSKKELSKSIKRHFQHALGILYSIKYPVWTLLGYTYTTERNIVTKANECYWKPMSIDSRNSRKRHGLALVHECTNIPSNVKVDSEKAHNVWPNKLKMWKSVAESHWELQWKQRKCMCEHRMLNLSKPPISCWKKPQKIVSTHIMWVL